MGKSLIIKGADFSQNGMPLFTEATSYQGYITTNPNSTSFGVIDLSTTTANNSLLTKILIPANSSVFIFVKDNGTVITDLTLGYVASQDNTEITNYVKVRHIAMYYHPADSLLREDDGSFLVENTSGDDLYFYMNICYNVIQGPAIPISGKHILYTLV